MCCVLVRCAAQGTNLSQNAVTGQCSNQLKLRPPRIDAEWWAISDSN